MIRLRPHHLLCILNFEGKGYTKDFVKKMTRLIQEIEKGRAVLIVTGPDDLCAALCQTPHWHCDKASISLRDKAALEQLGSDFNVGTTHTMHALPALKARFNQGAFHKVCVGCEWYEICYKSQSVLE